MSTRLEIGLNNILCLHVGSEHDYFHSDLPYWKQDALRRARAVGAETYKLRRVPGITVEQWGAALDELSQYGLDVFDRSGEDAEVAILSKE